MSEVKSRLRPQFDSRATGSTSSFIRGQALPTHQQQGSAQETGWRFSSPAGASFRKFVPQGCRYLLYRFTANLLITDPYRVRAHARGISPCLPAMASQRCFRPIIWRGNVSAITVLFYYARVQRAWVQLHSRNDGGRHSATVPRVVLSV